MSDSQKNTKKAKKTKKKKEKNEEKEINKDQVKQKFCDEDPPNIYRTCIKRASDPSNNLKEDEISCSPFKRSKAPFIDDDEELVFGSIHLTLSQEEPLPQSCGDLIVMEEVTLQFLQDNIGGDDTFSPVCVYIAESFPDSKIVHDGSGKTVETIALKLDIAFVLKLDFVDWIERQTGRRLEAEQYQREASHKNDHSRILRVSCDSSDYSRCCTQSSIDINDSKYCSSQACPTKKCGRKEKKKNRNNRMLLENSSQMLLRTGDSRKLQCLSKPIIRDLFGKDFKDVVATYSEFKPRQTRAILNASDTESVAVCTADRYIEDNFEIPFLCEEYKIYDCESNEDIIFKPNDPRCHPSSPTEVPTKSPTKMPTKAPTKAPSKAPTKAPTCDPINCDDKNACTIDTIECDNDQWRCFNEFKVCPPNFSCDPVDGLCKKDDELVPCVAVIDEDSDFTSSGSPDQASLWERFSTEYPSRPFCLLVPTTDDSDIVKPPENFLASNLTTVHYNITRDNGNSSIAVNWVKKCKLASYTSANVPWVALFIDDSGSLNIEDVAASLDLFNETLRVMGIDMKSVYNTKENWIEPFLTSLVPV